MRKGIRLFLLPVMLTLGLLGALAVASASEADAATQTDMAETTGTQTDTAAQTTTVTDTAAQTEIRTGWVNENGYYFYYSSSGKMYTGWKKINNRAYYFRKTADENGPAGSRMTGFQQIGSYTYYFSKKGILQTGWKKLGGEAYYFRKTGKLGVLGRMYTGFQKIGKYYYYFQADGKAATGWTKIKKKLYYFKKSSTLQVRGRAFTGWKKIGKYKYYFSSKGMRYTSRWISNKYYVDENGRLLTSCITPDGYVVNSSGARVEKANGWKKIDGKYYYYTAGKKAVGWKKISGKYYYFNEDGVRQKGWLKLNGATYYLKKYRLTGWQTIGGKRYYFKNNGKMVVNKTVDGYEIGADGVAVKKTGYSVLLIAGHGQGDVGAYGTYGSKTHYEYKYTREFATLIYNALKATSSKLNVTMYDQNYDCYQVVAGKKTGPNPNFTNYDYVLEVHFNATVESGKDSKGDGKQKGIGIYINSSKKDYTIDKNIIAAVAKQTGFAVWGRGNGIFTSPSLLNAKTCQSKGVSYGLLETAFIDDKDDLTFYNANKNAMAQAVAGAICTYFGV